jgi:RNA polymerase sigma-70 factor (ECF subfamily)
MALAQPLPAAATSQPADSEDQRLVERFRGGDRAAFDELVRRHQRAVFFIARRYVRDDAEAKDLTQRAFVRAFQGVAGLRGSAAFRTWIYKIVANLALNHLRDHARLRPTEDAGVDVAVEPVGAGRMAAAEDGARLRAAVARLPPKQRLVLELRVYDELPFREVAEVAGCSENAAKVNFHHAVKRLRELLGGGGS